MNTLEAIISRRSIRKFEEKPVPQEMVDELLKSAMYAPSAKNYRTWHFLVINERTKLDELSDLHPSAKMLKTATLAILVCGDRNLDPMDGYLAINTSAATQNILLAAHEMGLGSVWIGVFPREERIEEMVRYFNFPENILPVNLIAIGWPGEERPVPERFEPQKIHYNAW